jgi:hypothetical protein
MVRECCFTEWEQEIWLYLDNELPDEDRIRLERHLENCRRCREFLADVHPVEDSIRSRIRAAAADPLPESFADEVLNHLPAMIAVPRHQRFWLALRRNLAPQAVGQAMRHHPATVAAVFLLCLGSLFSGWLGRVDGDYRVKLVAWGERAFLVRLSESIHNPNGRLYELPDGSLLSAQSGTVFSIEAYQNNGDDRWISLTRGEIRLDVKTEAMQGFTVSTPEARVKVMGTCFVVRLENRETCVEVARGSVLVESVGQGQPKSCRLRAGERITANYRGRLLDWGQVAPERVRQVLAPFEAVRADQEPQTAPKSEPLINLPGK